MNKNEREDRESLNVSESLAHIHFSVCVCAMRWQGRVLKTREVNISSSSLIVYVYSEHILVLR